MPAPLISRRLAFFLTAISWIMLIIKKKNPQASLSKLGDL